MKKSTAIGAVLVTIVLVAGSVMLFFRSPGGTGQEHISLPGIAEEQTEPSENIAEINMKKVRQVVIGRENVQQVLATLSRPDEYWAETELKYTFTQDSEAVEQVFIVKSWVKGGKSKAELYLVRENARAIVKNTVLTPNNLYVWEKSAETMSIGKPGDFSGDDWAHIPTYEMLTSLDIGNISSGGLDESGEFILVESTNPDSGYREEWTVSVAKGLLVEYICYDGQQKVFGARVAASSAQDEGIDDEVFMLPTGNIAE